MVRIGFGLFSEGPNCILSNKDRSRLLNDIRFVEIVSINQTYVHVISSIVTGSVTESSEIRSFCS